MSSVSGSTGDGSEDCLTLNVWSPDLGAARLPVMVWIQGGTYLENHSANPHYDGATLARSGVVVVSMNYRVGADGFARITGAPDNRGILDQVAALRWVQDNIAAFGGDPANVTVFGQSAGAACIAALLVMPMAAGLFRRAISQSMPGTYFSERLATAISTTIAAQLGLQATVGDLARIPPRALTDATDAVIQKMPEFVDFWGPMALTPTPFSPIVDGDVLPRAPWRALADGAARDIDLLIGHTRDEYRLYTSRPGGEVRAHRCAHPNAANEITHVAHHMRTDWVCFAATGTPGWAPYDPQTRTTRVYNAEPTTQPYPEENSRRIWSAHQFDTLDLAT